MKSNENKNNQGTTSKPANSVANNQNIAEISTNAMVNLSENKPSTNNTKNNRTSSSNSSIEFIEFMGPDEKINIRKVIKYKEINEQYIKGEILGQGTFAKVRECIEKHSLKRYAVKIMKKDFLRRLGPNVRRNVEQEMQLVSKLNHKNVMQMIDIFSSKKKIYIFMEYCAGALTEIIEFAPDHKLPKWQTHLYFCQLIDGLKYLHSMGVYHRDIKDDNLLIDNSHNIKIADFGVSYVLDQFSETDIISGYEGTKLYQPPEHLDEKYSGSKFDVWSSGVLLFKMISGSYPFFNNKEDIMDKKSYDNLKYPKLIRKDRQLLDLMQKLLNVDFKARITIKGIKTHPWVKLKHKTDNEKKIDFPAKTFGDIYRGMTLMERLRVKFEYETPKSSEPEFVNQEEYEESIKPQDPNVRTDRSPTQRQPKPNLNKRRYRLGITD